jgi:hypothetical protein
MRNPTRKAAAVAIVAVLGFSVLLGGCSMPPALTQAQIDAKKTPRKHPTLSEKQRGDCRACHRVVAAPKKP